MSVHFEEYMDELRVKPRDSVHQLRTRPSGKQATQW